MRNIQEIIFVKAGKVRMITVVKGREVKETSFLKSRKVHGSVIVKIRKKFRGILMGTEITSISYDENFLHKCAPYFRRYQNTQQWCQNTWPYRKKLSLASNIHEKPFARLPIALCSCTNVGQSNTTSSNRS